MFTHSNNSLNNNENNNSDNNSWSTCLRLLGSIYLGEIVTMLSYLSTHHLRKSFSLSSEEDALFMVACSIPGIISGMTIWWSTGQIQNCVSEICSKSSSNKNNNKKFDFLLFFKSCSREKEKEYLSKTNDIEYGTMNINS
jgi:hypothetical protein